MWHKAASRISNTSSCSAIKRALSDSGCAKWQSKISSKDSNTQNLTSGSVSVIPTTRSLFKTFATVDVTVSDCWDAVECIDWVNNLKVKEKYITEIITKK